MKIGGFCFIYAEIRSGTLIFRCGAYSSSTTFLTPHPFLTSTQRLSHPQQHAPPHLPMYFDLVNLKDDPGIIPRLCVSLFDRIATTNDEANDLKVIKRDRGIDSDR